MRKGVIAYVGEFAFPEGTASASRVLNIARIIRECGYDVYFFGQQHATSKKYKSKGYYDGFMYSNNSYVGKTKLQNVLSFYTRGFDLCKALDGIENLSAVITYGGYTLNAMPLLKYCRKKEIPIFADVVEWFSYQTFKYGYLSFKTLNVHYAMTNVYTKFDGIIVISSYLENYYRLHGMQTIKIPPVVNLQDEKWLVKSYKKNGKLRICYAGVPGNKDYIQNVILAINELDDYSKSNIEFHLYGPTVSQIEKCLGKNAGVLNNIKSIVFVHGKIPQTEVPGEIAKNDFSVLLRPDMRFAHAGFPTKFVESFAVGLPVIANNTSDISKYLINGETGIVVVDCTVKECKKAILAALKMSYESRKRMKEKTRKIAEDNFDYKLYVKQMGIFLGDKI